MNETIKDILREMREQGKYNKENSDLDWTTEEVGDLQLRIADQIEAAYNRENAAWRNAVLDFCDVFTMVYDPPFKDCPALLSGAFMELCDKLGIEQVKIGDGNGK